MKRCCGLKMDFIDESFDHPFGTEEFKYYYCSICDTAINEAGELIT